MQNVSNLSILAMLIMYMLSALFGYLTFYGKSASPSHLYYAFFFFQTSYQIFVKSCFYFLSCSDNVEAELLHTFIKVYKFDTLLLLVRLAVLTAVTLTVPIVLFPVSTSTLKRKTCSFLSCRSSNQSALSFVIGALFKEWHD